LPVALTWIEGERSTSVPPVLPSLALTLRVPLMMTCEL